MIGPVLTKKGLYLKKKKVKEAGCFSLIDDEAKDISKEERIYVVVRYSLYIGVFMSVSLVSKQ